MLLDDEINKIGQNNADLTEIDLAHFDPRIDDEGAAALSKVLKTNNTLTSIDLYRNKIGDEGAASLAEALKINNTLTSIDLYRNKIDAGGAESLSEALKTNNTLKSINLGSNKIGAAGAAKLSEALKTNNSLKSIDLSYNQIGDQGAAKLSKALKTNNTLKSIDLHDNKISADGAASLAKALETNNTLTSIDLSYNKINFAGVELLAKVLETNNTLTRIKLSDNMAFSFKGHEVLKKIKKLLERNRECQEARELKDSIKEEKVSISDTCFNNEEVSKEIEGKTFKEKIEEFSKELENLEVTYGAYHAEARKQINAFKIEADLKLGNTVEALQYYAATSHEGAAPFGLLSLANALLAEAKVNNAGKEENIISDSSVSLEFPSLEEKLKALLYLFIDCLQSEEALSFFTTIKAMSNGMSDEASSVSDDLKTLIDKLLSHDKSDRPFREEMREAVATGKDCLLGLLQPLGFEKQPVQSSALSFGLFKPKADSEIIIAESGKGFAKKP